MWAEGAGGCEAEEAARGAPALSVICAGPGGDEVKAEAAGALSQPEPINWSEVLGER
jgi:hypothetical protein